MAKQLIKPTRDLVKNIKFGTLSVRDKKTFTELVAKAVHNKLIRSPIFDDQFLNKYSWINRGIFTKAIGEGIRFIIPQGINRVEIFKPPQPGDTACLKVPYPINEVSEIVGTIIRLRSGLRIPDILECHNIFTDIKTLQAFVSSKVGQTIASINLHLASYLEYAFAQCPWSNQYTAYPVTFGAGYLTSVAWDDQNEIGKTLEEIKTVFKTEFIDKELAVKNIYKYDAYQWMKHKLNAEESAAVNSYKSPNENLTENEIKKLVKDNTQISPVDSIVGICNAILHHVQEMQELSFQNDPSFPGDDETKISNYAKDAASVGIMCKANKEDIIVMMSKSLKNTIMSFTSLSKVNPVGTFVNTIQEVSRLNLVGNDLMPHHCIKIFDKNRYGIYSLYDIVGTDKLVQELLTTQTAHKSIMMYVRTKGVAMRVLNISNVYVDPLAMSAVVKLKEAVNIK